MAVPMKSASDLSGFSWSLFCIYHCLTSVVQAARIDRPAVVVDAHRWMELSVIGVLMALDAVGRDDVSDWAAKHTEQYGSLGYSDVQGGFRRPMLP